MADNGRTNTLTLVRAVPIGQVSREYYNDIIERNRNCTQSSEQNIFFYNEKK